MSTIKTDSELELNKKITFTIRDTECNSRVFGDCEICNNMCKRSNGARSNDTNRI